MEISNITAIKAVNQYKGIGDIIDHLKQQKLEKSVEELKHHDLNTNKMDYIRNTSEAKISGKGSNVDLYA